MAERWLGISKGTLLSMLLAVSNEVEKNNNHELVQLQK